MFKKIPNRDAWSTIRGFVYQVDVTILRWVELGQNEVLELEHGEDIDIVLNDIENREISRELEQIKFRQSNVTLNQDVVLEMLLNFILSKRQNPSQKLHFRFVSNTSYGIERPSLFPNGKGGIEVWIDLYNSKNIDYNDERGKGIKNHLLRKIQEKIGDDLEDLSKKEKTIQEHWRYFKSNLEDDNLFFELIKSFEWSLKNDDNVQISDSILKKLISNKFVEKKSEAESVYHRLFLFVFKLLSQKSLKQLDSEKLKKQLSISELSTSDKEQLIFIKDLISSLERRVLKIEEQLQINTSNISSIIEGIEYDTIFEYKINTLSTKPPSLIKNGSLRKEKVSRILSMYKKCSWIGFQGIKGTGKSQLAALISHKYEHHWWLNLRSFNDDLDKSTILCEGFLSEISKCQFVNNRNIWIENVTSSIPENSLIIINDLPRLTVENPLSELLMLLVNEIPKFNIKLLTTSNFKIQNAVKEQLEENCFMEYYDFDFTDDEFIEYLINSGADNRISEYITLLVSVSHRNPRLISEMIYHLKKLNWGENSDDLFEVIVKKEFTSEILENAQLSIKKFIKEEKSRELLYRLSLIHWNFNFKEIKEVCEVEDKILHPNARFQDLVNIWVQDQGDKTYHVSPLVYDIGQKNLNEDVINNVHFAVGQSILSNKIIDQISAFRCVISFLNAKEYNHAGDVLLNVYKSAKSKVEINELKKWGFLNFWSHTDIPKAMNVILRAYIRSEQIRLYRSINKDSTKLLKWLREYLKEDLLENNERILLYFLNITVFKGGDFTNYWIYLKEVILNWSSLKDSLEEIDDSEVVIGLLLMPIQYLESDSDIQNWLKSVSLVENEIKTNFFSENIAQIAISLIVKKIINTEELKEQKDENLGEIIPRLKYLASYFNEHNLEILESLILKEIISLGFRINNSFSIAVDETNLNIPRFSKSESKYLLFDNLGKLYYDNNNSEGSRQWFFKALEFNCITQPGYIDTLIYTACSISKADSLKSIELLKQGIKLAYQRDDYLELDYIQILGELGIAYWLAGKFNDSFKTFENVVNRLYKAKKEFYSNNWIRLFSWSGHSLGYISASVNKENAPKYLSDGGTYIKPYQGIYYFNTKDLSDIYDPVNDPFLMVHMAVFSEGVNNIEKAYQWAQRAFDLSRKRYDQKKFHMISTTCSQYSLINFKCDETLESYLLSAAVLCHIEGTPKERYDKLSEVNLTEIIAVKPSEYWNAAESTTVSFAIIPLFIIVLAAQLENLENKYERIESFVSMIKNYMHDASDKILWELLLELSAKIFDKRITTKDLINRGNTFAEQDRQNLQIICYLGYVFLTKDVKSVIPQLINIFPYLTKIHKVTRSVIKYVLFPFVKNRCLYVLNEEFVGARNDLNEILNIIENVDHSDKHAIQLVLQPVVKELELNIPDDRGLWLYQFEEI